MSTGECLYRILLWLYPAEHRQRFGELMLQHARDMDRDASTYHGWLKALFYLRLVSDAFCNAVIEHWEEMMAKNNLAPASWLTVFLAVIPGLLVAFTHYRINPIGDRLAALAWIGYLGLLVIGVPLILARQRRLPAWALLPLGLLGWFAVYFAGTFLAERWHTFGLLRQFSGDIEGGIFLIQLIITIIIFSIMLYGRRISLLAWPVLGAIIIVNWIAAAGYLTRWPGIGTMTGILQYLTVSGFFPIEQLMLVAFGLLVVRQHGLRALLVIIGGYGYMLLDSDYISGPGMFQWPGYLIYAFCMTALCLIVIPIAMLRARTRWQLALASFIPFGTFLFASTLVPTYTLHGSYQIPWQSISILLSLFLGWLLYDNLDRQYSLEQQAALPEPDFQTAL